VLDHLLPEGWRENDNESAVNDSDENSEVVTHG
jgi:hypothetical protein